MRTTLRGWARALTLLWLVLGLPATAVQAATVLMLTTSPVPAGKFVMLARQAQAQGFELRTVWAERLPVPSSASHTGAGPTGAALWQGADLVLVDAPRDHMATFIRSRVQAALPALAQRPHAWIGTASVQPGGGLAPALAQRWHRYYVNGGSANLAAFIRSVGEHLRGRDLATQVAAGLPEPLEFPAAGVYHPQAPRLVFSQPADYLAWQRSRPAARATATSTAHTVPVVGIALHQQSIASGQTAFIDDLIARIEAAGAVALPFYSPVMEADAITRMVAPGGQPLVDVLINTQIMLNPEGRRAEFAALGLPVLQAMPYRRGDEAAWAADPQGVQLMDVPFYLAQAEYAGVIDIQIAAATRAGDEQVVPIAAQSAAIVGKALRLARLQRSAHADKRVALMFWNYPAGEKNLSASFLNVPRSLEAVLAALKDAGYRTQAATEAELIPRLQRLLAPAYRPPEDREVLRQLLRDGLAELLPIERYSAWLASLPAPVREELLRHHGEPGRSSMVLRHEGREGFVIPRLALGQTVLLPQSGRADRGEGSKEKALYHSTQTPPSHFYLASYLWLREQFGADALIHFGTHGSQEWLPGKERGLSMHDYPHLALGDVPVIYPYIVDNIGEAVQAKRRGRAVILSHQTPPFSPAGLHERLTRIHDLLHQWQAQDGGSVKEQLRAEFLQRVRAERIHLDLGWSDARISQDFEAFSSAVHAHLHELAQTAQPVGLHTYGQGSALRWRMATVLMMLGRPFWEGVADPGNPQEEADELMVADYQHLTETQPYRLLAAYLQDGREPPHLTAAARALLPQARRWFEDLGARQEMSALLAALAGRHIPTSYGGDPLKNPDALPTGRNLYGFDPSRVPTPAAWEAARQAFEQLLAAHRQQTGQVPTKLSFSLWSVETMRHMGLLEAQVLWALGVRPVWDAGGRVTDVQLIPRAELGRARVDVVLSATGLYRDHFPNTMRMLAKAVQLAADAREETDNPVAANTQRIERQLMANGTAESEARKAGATRIFSSESGRYGTGLDDAALATDTWKTQAEGDRKLAELYLSRMQFAYGPDESQWGQAGVAGAPRLNLYAEHLRGTQGAVLSRSSQLYGMLTTDDPFQYLGGLGLAVRHLDGQAPALYISNLRGTGAGKVESAAQFLAKELATRNFHPGYIQGLMQEGYAGTLQVLDGINNFAGWQSVAREIVRHDQWQEFVDVYVRDKHQLGLARWFEQHNPHALAQSIERMLEAARQGQWQADAATVAELKQRWQALARRHRVRSDNAAFTAFVQNAPTGFGQLTAGQAAPPARAQPSPRPPQDATPAPPALPPAPPPVQGLRLERVPEARTPGTPQATWIAGLALALLMLGGAWRGARRPA